MIGNFVMGLDGERKGVGDRISSFVESTAIPMIYLNTLQVLPRTKLWNRLKEEGRLLEERTSGQTTAGRLNYIPTRPEEDVMDEYLRTWNFLYDPPLFLARTLRHFLAMRPTRYAMAVAQGLPVPAGLRRYKATVRESLGNLRRLCILVWWQGIRPPHRLQFWKQAIGLGRKSPSRASRYFNTTIMGENIFRLRDTVRQRVAGVKDRKTSREILK